MKNQVCVVLAMLALLLACSSEESVESSDSTMETDSTREVTASCPSETVVDGTPCDEEGAQCPGEIPCFCGGAIDTTCECRNGSFSCGNDCGDGPPCPEPTCREQEDCSSDESCVDEDAELCGTCMSPPTCTDASECGTGEVCSDRMTRCGCNPGEKACVPACSSDSDCVRPGDTCDNGACVETVCTSDVDCPAYFSCTSGVCDRTSCSDDTVCGDGFCVNGGCYSSLGSCSPPVP